MVTPPDVVLCEHVVALSSIAAKVVQTQWPWTFINIGNAIWTFSYVFTGRIGPNISSCMTSMSSLALMTMCGAILWWDCCEKSSLRGIYRDNLGTFAARVLQVGIEPIQVALADDRRVVVIVAKTVREHRRSLPRLSRPQRTRTPCLAAKRHSQVQGRSVRHSASCRT